MAHLTLPILYSPSNYSPNLSVSLRMVDTKGLRLISEKAPITKNIPFMTNLLSA